MVYVGDDTKIADVGLIHRVRRHSPEDN